MVEVEAGVLTESLGCVRVGGLVQTMQGSGSKAVAPVLPFNLRCLQAVTQRHQFIHVGNNAVLLGKRRHRHNTLVNIVSIQAGLYAFTKSVKIKDL
jgi:hypothetical protein